MNMFKWNRLMGLFLLLLCLVALVVYAVFSCNGAAAEAIAQTALVVVNDPNVGTLNVRKEPSIESKIVTELRWHEEVEVIQVVDGWGLIRFAGDTKPLGWSSMKYLAIFQREGRK